jgi:hypothetical protein
MGEWSADICTREVVVQGNIDASDRVNRQLTPQAASAPKLNLYVYVRCFGANEMIAGGIPCRLLHRTGMMTERNRDRVNALL